MILYYYIGINYHIVFNYLKLIDLLIDFPGYCITFIGCSINHILTTYNFFYSSDINSVCNVCAYYNIDLNKKKWGSLIYI